MDPPIFSGFVSKESGSTRGKFQRRFLTLHRQCLRYWKREGASEPAGVIPLSSSVPRRIPGVPVSPAGPSLADVLSQRSTNLQQKRFNMIRSLKEDSLEPSRVTQPGFVVDTPGRKYVFHCSSTEDEHQWLENIRSSLFTTELIRALPAPIRSPADQQHSTQHPPPPPLLPVGRGSPTTTSTRTPAPTVAEVHSGYLEKRGGALGTKAYKRRFMIIRGRFLKYFSTQQAYECDLNPKGTICLDFGATIQMDVQDSRRFFVRCSQSGRMYYLRADTPEDREKWNHWIRGVIEKERPAVLKCANITRPPPPPRRAPATKPHGY